MRKTLDKYVDTEEFIFNPRTKRRRKGLRTRSSADGVLISPMRQRMLGWHQVESLANALLIAAKHAKDRGAHSHLVQA